VSGGAITVLPPLGPTNVKGGGYGEEGAIDEQTAGRDDNGAHYDMNCIGLAYQSSQRDQPMYLPTQTQQRALGWIHWEQKEGG
jgi:hypothetical protein